MTLALDYTIELQLEKADIGALLTDTLAKVDKNLARAVLKNTDDFREQVRKAVEKLYSFFQIRHKS